MRHADQMRSIIEQELDPTGQKLASKLFFTLRCRARLRKDGKPCRAKLIRHIVPSFICVPKHADRRARFLQQESEHRRLRLQYQREPDMTTLKSPRCYKITDRRTRHRHERSRPRQTTLRITRIILRIIGIPKKLPVRIKNLNVGRNLANNRLLTHIHANLRRIHSHNGRLIHAHHHTNVP